MRSHSPFDNKTDRFEVVLHQQLAKCKYCHHTIVWILSKNTGKRYPVNFSAAQQSEGEELLVNRADIHKCSEREKAMRHKS